VARRVELESKSINDYRALVGGEAVGEIEELAASVQGARVLHLSATAYGGGVAEILQTLVPLMRGLGLDAEWHVLSGNDGFFRLTKKLHSGLQGMSTEFHPALRDLYLSTLDENMDVFGRDWDYVVVHDPQPVGLAGILDGRRTGHWIWRCHIDTSTPDEAALDFLSPHMDYFEVAVFTLPAYVTPYLSSKRTEFIQPAIDPLVPKNRALAPSAARKFLAGRFGIDRERPLMTQVSRYDPWKDPLGVIDAYRAVKRLVPDVQLALVGNMADDDPEGIEYHARTVTHAGTDPDIHVLSTLDRLSRDSLNHALEVNAFQSGSDVVVQKSIREGFGLVVTEAMWKGTPVVGGRAGGIVEQISDGVTGFLASSAEECADRVVELLRDPGLRQRLGSQARDSVRQRSLTPRLLADYLRIFESLA
jgi:trehalose synthase